MDSGVWPLYRFDPRRLRRGSRRWVSTTARRKLVAEYMRNETRFRMVERTDPARFKGFLKDAQEAARQPLCGVRAARGNHRAIAEVKTGEFVSPAAEEGEETMDLHQYLGLAVASIDGGRVTAGRDSTLSSGSRMPAPPPSSCAPCSKSRSRGTDVGLHRPRRPRRIVRRGRQHFPSPDDLRGSLRVPGAPAAGEEPSAFPSSLPLTASRRADGSICAFDGGGGADALELNIYHMAADPGRKRLVGASNT